MFCKEGVLRNFLEGRRPATLWKKRLWHRTFPVNFAKILRTPFLLEHHRWLLLIFAVEFVEILFCYEPMTVKKSSSMIRNFFVISFIISMLVIWSNKNNKNLLPSILSSSKTSLTLPGELPKFFVSYHFIFTKNKHGVAKLIRFLKQKWLMLEVQVNEY